MYGGGLGIWGLLAWDPTLQDSAVTSLAASKDQGLSCFGSSMAPAHSKPDADPEATAAARKRKSKESGVNAALARGKLRRLEEDGHFKKSSLVIPDGSCDLTIKDLMTSENLTFEEAIEVAQRFRAEAAEATDHPKAGGVLPSSSRGPGSPVPKTPDPKPPAPRGILKKKAVDEGAEEGAGSAKAGACVTFKPEHKDAGEVKEESSQVSRHSSNASAKSCRSEKGAARPSQGLEREEVQEGGSAKNKKEAGGKAKEEKPEPVVPKASKKKTDKAEEVQEPGEGSSSSSKRKRKDEMYDELARFGDFIDEGVSEAEPLRKNLRKLKAQENLEEQEEMEERHAAWIEWWETLGQYEHELGWEDWEDWQGCGDSEWEGGDSWWGEQVAAEGGDLVPRRLRFKQPEAKVASPPEEYSQDRQPDPILACGW